MTVRPTDGWVNASNDGCKGEEHLIRERATFLLSGMHHHTFNATHDVTLDERNGREIYDRQDFFSVYVHASPGYEFPKNSLFSGTLLD